MLGFRAGAGRGGAPKVCVGIAVSAIWFVSVGMGIAVVVRESLCRGWGVSRSRPLHRNWTTPPLTLAPASVILKALRITLSVVMLGFRATLERFQMYLTTLDLLAVMIALVVSVTLVITSAVANARLTRSVQEYRKAYLDLKAGK